jgi:signal transduction histidine kinase
MQSPDILLTRRGALLGCALAALMVLAAALFAWHGIDAGTRRLAAAQLSLLPRVLALEQLRHDADAPIRTIDGFAAQASLSRFRAGGSLTDQRPQMGEAWQALVDALAAYADRDTAAGVSADQATDGAPSSVLIAGQRLIDQLRDTAAGIDRGVSPIARADSGRLLRAAIGQFRATLDDDLGHARGALTTELAAASAAADRAWWTLGAVMLPMLLLTLAGASGIVRRLVRPGPGSNPGKAETERRPPAVGRKRAGEPHREMTMIDNWLSRALATYPLPGGIALHTELTSGARAIIERDRFLRVLVILLDNAVRAMTDQPWASSRERARSITVRSEAAGPHLRLSVMDTGPGIPAERLADVFDAAADAEDGLPAVRQIVEEHGGTVDIESAADQGTDIVIWLPRHLTPAAGVPSIREEAAA